MCAALLVLLLPAAIPIAQSPSRGFPAPIEQYLSKVVHPTPAERKQLLDGMAMARLLTVTGGNEIAVFGAVWIKSTIDLYVQRLGDIEQFERGQGFKVTKRISNPPKLSDFDALRLPDEDVRDLRTCRVDNCEVKLGEKAVQRFRSEINWKAPDMRPAVDKLMRQLALEYATGYLAGGNAQLAVFRDSGKPTSVAKEFRDMVEHMPDLALWAPDLKRYLVDFPAVTLPSSTSFLYWQETEFGLKPTIRMSHVTMRQAPTETIVASRMLYASHYFWTGLELRALLPDPSRGQGFWYVTTSRSRLDGLSGLTGAFVRRRVRSEVLLGTTAALRTAKDKMEQTAAKR
jgi:hypothetical protein